MPIIVCAMIFAGAVAFASPSVAESDPMEAQRCIWACMSNTPGWDGRNFKAYERCTKKNCSGRSSQRRRR